MFEKVLIANRGEIACRIIKTCKRLGIKSVAVFSDADIKSRHVSLADEAFHIGHPEAIKSYLNIDSILNVARRSNAEAVHPGYGFLSENSEFALALESQEIKFVGPPTEAIRLMGSKSESKITMRKAGIPVVPGFDGENQDLASLKNEAEKIGLPLLVKATFGGGGKGMRLVSSIDNFEELCQSAKNEGLRSFGNDSVILEKFIARPRHIEVQIFGDSHGNYVYLFERDCSSQRRHQKIVEEAPAPSIDEELRKRLGSAAVEAARIVGYIGAGTVEFLLDLDTGEFFFLEMNTRLQVEHPITEMITGVDLVEWQFQIAAGHKLPLSQADLKITGSAIEARIYAENPLRNFAPDTGVLTRFVHPLEDECFRFETGVNQGDLITVYYDPMIAKVVTHGINRTAALEKMNDVLRSMEVGGVATNIEFVKALLRDKSFLDAKIDSNYIDKHYMKLLPSQTSHEVVAPLVAAHLCKSSVANPWARVYLPRKSKFELLIEGRKTLVEVGRTGLCEFEIQIGKSNFKVYHIDGEDPVYMLDDCLHRPHFIDTPSGLNVFLNGNKSEVEIIQSRSSSTQDVQAEEVRVKSSMPSKITMVHVKTGDTVSKGDKLVVCEAMKMEHLLKAPIDGVVVKVSAKPGQMVAGSELLVVLERK